MSEQTHETLVESDVSEVNLGWKLEQHCGSGWEPISINPITHYVDHEGQRIEYHTYTLVFKRPFTPNSQARYLSETC